MGPKSSSGKFPSFSFELKAPAPTSKPTLQNTLVPHAQVRPSSPTNDSKRTVGPGKFASSVWYCIDTKGDFDIFNYEGKLDSSQVPLYKRQASSPLGFSTRFKIVFEPSGGFSVVSSEPKKSLAIRIWDLPPGEFVPTTHFQLDGKLGSSLTEPFMQFSSEQAVAPIVDESFSQRRLEIEKKLHANQRNVDAWLELVGIQDSLKVSFRAIVEKKIAICEKALMAVGANLPLTRLFIELQRDLCRYLWFFGCL